MNPFGILTPEDAAVARAMIGSYRNPDKIIMPHGTPYLYRWHLLPVIRGAEEGNVFFHIQVASDPARPLHDHPWDNCSLILAGGYTEILNLQDGDPPGSFERRTGDMIYRKAAWPHRLLMSAIVPYTMTLFTTGPKIREWGFLYPHGWVHHSQVCVMENGVSVHREPKKWQ